MPKFTKDIFEKQMLEIVRRPKPLPGGEGLLQKLLQQAKVKEPKI